MIVCSTVRGARLTLCTVQVIDLEDFLAVAPCADLTIHSVARRKGTLVRSGVTVSVGRDEPRCTAPRTRVDRGGEFAQASVASSSSADACATCSFSPRPFSLLPLSSQLVDSSRSCRHRSGTGFGSDGKVRTHVLLASGGLATPGPSTGSWRPSALVLRWFGPLQRSHVRRGCHHLAPSEGNPSCESPSSSNSPVHRSPSTPIGRTGLDDAR